MLFSLRTDVKTHVLFLTRVMVFWKLSFPCDQNSRNTFKSRSQKLLLYYFLGRTIERFSEPSLCGYLQLWCRCSTHLSIFLDFTNQKLVAALDFWAFKSLRRNFQKIITQARNNNFHLVVCTCYILMRSLRITALDLRPPYYPLSMWPL